MGLEGFKDKFRIPFLINNCNKGISILVWFKCLNSLTELTLPWFYFWRPSVEVTPKEKNKLKCINNYINVILFTTFQVGVRVTFSYLIDLY